MTIAEMLEFLKWTRCNVSKSCIWFVYLFENGLYLSIQFTYNDNDHCSTFVFQSSIFDEHCNAYVISICIRCNAIGQHDDALLYFALPNQHIPIYMYHRSFVYPHKLKHSSLARIIPWNECNSILQLTWTCFNWELANRLLCKKDTHRPFRKKFNL